MNKTKLLTIAVIGLLLLNLGMMCMMFFHHPEDHHPPFGGPHEGPKMIIIQKLHFDEEQQKQYEVLVQDHRQKSREMNSNARDLRNKLYSLLKSEHIDTAQQALITDQIAENQKKTEEINIDHFQKIKALCKPDQLEAFNNLVDELTELFEHTGPPKR